MSALKRILLTTVAGLTLPAALSQAASSPPVQSQTANFVYSGDPDGKPYIVRMRTNVPVDSQQKAVRDIQEGGPWLGIQFGPVPKPLSAQLGLEEGTGQMVLNLTEGSPADIAGFQQYDVITAIDSNDASANIGDFLNVVRNFSPNQSHTFTVIRGGKSIQSNVVVGTRPADLGETKYKYEMSPEEVSGNRLFQRGGILQKDDQGNWAFKGLDQLQNMPDVWQYFSTPGESRMMQIPGGNSTQLHVFNDNDKTVQIQKDADGKIHVTKTETVNGQKSTTESEYNDDAAFEASDPDSYKIYKNQVNQPFHFNFSLPRGTYAPMPDMKDYQDLFKQWEGPVTTPKDMQKWMKQHDKALKRYFGDNARTPGGAFYMRPGGTSFETNADGSIRVLTRRGGDELVETYTNAQALKNARPDLYKKYQKLVDGNDAEE